MGNRITRAAGHLPVEAVQERIQRENRPWVRQRWEILYQALVAPRPAWEIARTVGVSPSTVHKVVSMYKRGGAAAIKTAGKGGRRRQYLTLEQEHSFLQPFLECAARGEMTPVGEIKLALEAQIGHQVNTSTVYRLLDRTGRQLRISSRPAQGEASQVQKADPMPTGEESRSAYSQTVPRPQKRQALSRTRSANRRPASQRYPSDLSEQEWAILEPLIPPAKPGGRPRSVEMREVINAILYVDRTGCQWRALPTDFPPWPTVWTYFRTWRNDGTWERLHTARSLSRCA